MRYWDSTNRWIVLGFSRSSVYARFHSDPVEVTFSAISFIRGVITDRERTLLKGMVPSSGFPTLQMKKYFEVCAHVLAVMSVN
jgi:hypothetical protein